MEHESMLRWKKASLPRLQSSHQETSYNVSAWCVCVCMVTMDVRIQSRLREGEIRADLQWITSLAGQTCREASCLATVLTEEKDKEGGRGSRKRLVGWILGTEEARKRLKKRIQKGKIEKRLRTGVVTWLSYPGINLHLDPRTCWAQTSSSALKRQSCCFLSCESTWLIKIVPWLQRQQMKTYLIVTTSFWDSH